MGTTLAERVFYWMPLPIFGIGLLLALAGAMWGGQLAGNAWRAWRGGADAGQEENVVGAALGLLALLLGFTFSMAVDRYDVRRSMVTQEANAIATTYRMAQTFGEPDRSRISGILTAYVDHRLITAVENDPGKARRLVKQSDRIKALFWAASLAATERQRDDVSSTFLQAGGTMLEISRRREAARRGVVPTTVHLITIAFLLISSAVLGSAYKGGAPRVSVTMLAMYTLTMMMIISLDRPTSGRLKESQRSMELLRDELRIYTPASYERLQEGFDRPALPAAAP